MLRRGLRVFCRSSLGQDLWSPGLLPGEEGKRYRGYITFCIIQHCCLSSCVCLIWSVSDFVCVFIAGLLSLVGDDIPGSIKQQQEPELPSQSTTGFQALQAEVKPQIHILETLTLKHRQSLMEALLGLLGQAKALQELEDTMNRALDLEEPVTPGFLGGPGDAILAKLQDASGKLNPSWAGSILYLLGALHELSEEQQQLLSMSVEKKILSQQLQLMKTILDENFLRTEAGPFPLHCELLQSLQGEELIVTQALIGLCGLDLQGNGPLFAWDPHSLPLLCALYAALSVFQALSRTSWFSSPFTKVLNTLNFSRREKQSGI
ncbi:gasdermin-A-like [Monodelphis domestica]|uniref:gasdermin-A-like n=1 Tax=Monodelphis domestica TaxID=13616 RepID=UPI0024E20CF5|nr:gasdermin-A-like [Monodelphis domestica]